MLEHIISASSRPGALVLDCFGGSGSTAIAAQKLGRNYLVFEIDPHWAAVARQKLGESTEFVTDSSRREWLERKTQAKPEPSPQLSLFDLSA
jgi:site-specific DNA-methyltransferase (adenine-specific)